MFEISTNFLQDKIFLSLYKLAIIRQLKILLVYRTLSGLDNTNSHTNLYPDFPGLWEPFEAP